MGKTPRYRVNRIKTKSDDAVWWRSVRFEAAQRCFDAGWETNMWINLFYWAGDFEC